jgi:hypothetical protein
MKMWITRNIRLGLWIHAAFLFVVDLCFAPALVGSVADFLLRTAFLTHFVLMMTFASQDYPEREMFVRSVLVLIISFPLSLMYASALNWVARFFLSLRHRKTIMSDTNV